MSCKIKTYQFVCACPLYKQCPPPRSISDNKSPTPTQTHLIHPNYISPSIYPPISLPTIVVTSISNICPSHNQPSRSLLITPFVNFLFVSFSIPTNQHPSSIGNNQHTIIHPNSPHTHTILTSFTILTTHTYTTHKQRKH